MISAVLFISFFVFPDHGSSHCNLSGTVLRLCNPVPGTSLPSFATNMYAGISKFLLLAILVFRTFRKYPWQKPEFPKRLVRFVDTCVGHKRGGIAIVCVIVACFGAIFRIRPATVAALGAVLIPAMVEREASAHRFPQPLDGNIKLHRHCHPRFKYCICCICFYHRRIYCRYVPWQVVPEF